MIKGEIWWAKLPSPRGSEPGKIRPVLIIQAGTFNRSSISTIICAVITSNTALTNAPANILLEKSNSHLEKTSVINFSQIITIDKSYFTQFIAMLPQQILTKINHSIKLIFDVE
ncbi:MAG: type II toxin-antitoxin system PemK/MazF family toxin [Bacteroidetes bacterium]|nr:type II toxin-antitoxin system PemK/MazF family toxin [Bacteroidota bacterium]